MDTMFHLRLLSARREVLGWNKIPAETRGDGCLWAKPGQSFTFEADADGVGVAVNFHWPDVHVHLTMPLPESIAVTSGKVYSIRLDHPMLRIASEPLDLPPVTVRTPQTIGVAGARG